MYYLINTTTVLKFGVYDHLFYEYSCGKTCDLPKSLLLYKVKHHIHPCENCVRKSLAKIIKIYIYEYNTS